MVFARVREHTQSLYGGPGGVGTQMSQRTNTDGTWESGLKNLRGPKSSQMYGMWERERKKEIKIHSLKNQGRPAKRN